MINLIAVVVSYNNLHFLKKCIQSFKLGKEQPNQIIVVDNNSTDGSQIWLQSQNDIYSVLLNSNKGGSYAYNLGIKFAIKHDADYIFTTDEDTLIGKKCIASIREFINKNKIDFLVSNVLTKTNETNRNNLTQIKNEKIYTSTFVGACFNSKIFNQIGLPYKNLFRYYDDIEFFFRIYKNTGLKGVLLEGAEIIHFSEGNTWIDNYRNIYKNKHYKYFIRNDFFFRRKELGFYNTFKVLITFTFNSQKVFGLMSMKSKIYIAYFGLKGLFFIPKQ